jgi:hypothetical protein
MKLLANEFGARSVGMGGAYTAVTSDPFSAAYNPAATFGITKLTGSLGYDTQWKNTRIESGYLSYEVRSVVLTAGVQFGAVTDIKAMDVPVDDPVLFDFHDVSAKIGAAFEIDSNYVLGFALGVLYEENYIHHGSAFAFDLGLLMTPYPNLNVGLSVINFGSTIKIYREHADLPTTYRGGVSYKYKNVTGALDAVYLENELYFNLGGEYNIYKNFFIRSGYRIGYSDKSFSAGLGFAKRKIRIDYAFLPRVEGLNDSHLFNLTFEI